MAEPRLEAEPVATENLPPGLNPIAVGENEEVASAVEGAARCEGADHCPVPDELLVSLELSDSGDAQSPSRTRGDARPSVEE